MLNCMRRISRRIKEIAVSSLRMTQGWDIDLRISSEWERTMQVGRAWYCSRDFFAPYNCVKRL